MAEVCGIYVLRNSVNDKLYVGQSVHIKRRWSEHKKSAKTGSSFPISCAIRKHGAEAFTVEILEECSPESLDAREEHWMTELLVAGKTYNIMPAGQRGRIMDAATREHISAKLRGRKLPHEHVENIRRGQIGREHTEEAKEKIAAWHRGRPKSAESVAKRAESLRNRHARMLEAKKVEYAAARSGWRHTEACRAAMSARRRGVKKTPEQVANMKLAAQNRNPEAEARRVAALRAAAARKREARTA